MRKLNASDVRDLHLLKHYRIIRQWACKNNGLNSADLELLIYLDCVGLFNRLDFINGSYSYSWETRRWSKLKQNGWITLFSARNRTTVKSNIYKVSFKGKQLISRMYRIMLGDEDIPTSTKRNSIMKGKKYTDKVLIKSIKNVNNDKSL
jgi:hypothetical protein